MKLTNNTILVTGGTSGIGLALATKLNQLGNQVIVLGRNQKRIEEVAKKNPELITHQTDISNSDDVEALAEWITASYPQLNIVINSAGIMHSYSLFDEELSIAKLTAEIQTNLIGTIAVDKTLLNHLVKQPESLIVNVSSGLANVSSAAHPVYSATKAGVHMFTDALREQLLFTNQDQVHVMELVPPLVAETNLEPDSDTSVSGNMSLADLVNAAIIGMEKDKIRVNAGYAKALRKAGQVAPDVTEHQMAQTMLPQYFPEGLR